MRQQVGLRISHIGVHDTSDLFSITKSWIYNKEKREQVKVIIIYESVMDSNTFLFEPNVPKIGHSQVGNYQFSSTYAQVVSQQVCPIKPKKCIKPVFLFSQFRK